MNEKNENEINVFDAIINFISTFVTLGITAFILAAPIMSLWNWLMPHLFGVPHLAFMESFGLTLLVSLLTVR